MDMRRRRRFVAQCVTVSKSLRSYIHVADEKKENLTFLMQSSLDKVQFLSAPISEGLTLFTPTTYGQMYGRTCYLET